MQSVDSENLTSLNDEYDTVLDRFNDRPIQEQFPNAKAWEREVDNRYLL
jgi:hypothetical protein